MWLAVRWLGLLLGLVLGGASAANADSESRWKTPDALVDAFVELALKSGYSTRVNPVRKWTVPIRYAIVHRVGEEALHARLVETHLIHLAQITGHSIDAAATAEQANYVVVLTREDQLEADTRSHMGADSDGRREGFYRDSMCLASFRVGPRGAIVRAVAMIPVDRARGKGELIGCVTEELTHMLGLANDTAIPMPTIFHHGTVRSFLTGLDWLLLKMLYDPRVKPGMKEAQLRPILLQIALELQRGHLIGVADRVAAQGGLSGLSP
ncbi:MAG: DUF2927 domain-containing protein [Rhodocyclales bacterium]|nr:DUF2927 domain-containing protein [Rhodocyclales bacterium]